MGTGLAGLVGVGEGTGIATADGVPDPVIAVGLLGLLLRLPHPIPSLLLLDWILVSTGLCSFDLMSEFLAEMARMKTVCKLPCG